MNKKSKYESVRKMKIHNSYIYVYPPLIFSSISCVMNNIRLCMNTMFVYNKHIDELLFRIDKVT